MVSFCQSEGVSGGVSGGVNGGVSGGVNGGVNSGVSGGVNELLVFINSNPGLKTAQIKEAFDHPQRTLERWLKQLRDEGKIEFRGAPKTGGYYPMN